MKNNSQFSTINFQLSNLNNMRLFYLRYPNLSDTSGKFNLSWSHICELIKMVEYATYGIDSKIFVSKYELYLPKKEELQAIVNKTIG